MGERIKQAVFVLLVAFAAWKGWQKYKQSQTSGTLMFTVEGPTFCRVDVHYTAGDQTFTESLTTPWRSQPVTVSGSAEVTFQVDIPLSCGWQPHQVRCVIEKNGAPWRTGETAPVVNARDGVPSMQRCSTQ